MSDLLSIQNLNAWYTPGKPVLKGLSLELHANEITGLIGLNGAGKTTFLNILSGLHKDFQADGLKKNRKPVSFRDEVFKKCRYTVFAEDHSFSFFTFREYVSYVFGAYKKPLPKAEDLIQGFGFEAYTDKLLGDLSMGNRKKAFLITAFALKPELLLLDEPITGLDPAAIQDFYRLIHPFLPGGAQMRLQSQQKLGTVVLPGRFQGAADFHDGLYFLWGNRGKRKERRE